MPRCRLMWSRVSSVNILSQAVYSQAVFLYRGTVLPISEGNSPKLRRPMCLVRDSFSCGVTCCFLHLVVWLIIVWSSATCTVLFPVYWLHPCIVDLFYTASCNWDLCTRPMLGKRVVLPVYACAIVSMDPYTLNLLLHHFIGWLTVLFYGLGMYTFDWPTRSEYSIYFEVLCPFVYSLYFFSVIDSICSFIQRWRIAFKERSFSVTATFWWLLIWFTKFYANRRENKRFDWLIHWLIVRTQSDPKIMKIKFRYMVITKSWI